MLENCIGWIGAVGVSVGLTLTGIGGMLLIIAELIERAGQ
jgi:hypothetical protein